MAKFPMSTPGVSIPGTSGSARARIDTRTGGEYVAESLGDLGGAMGRMGASIFRAQGEAELVQATAQDEDAIQRMLLRFKQNTDETTYEDDFRQTLGEIEGREVKNGWARRRRMNMLPRMRVHYEGLVNEAIESRIDSNWEASYANARAKAIQGAGAGVVQGLLDSRVRQGKLTPDGAEAELREVNHLAARNLMERTAANDPEKILALDSFDKMKAAYPDMLPTDYAYIHGLAVSAKDGQKRKAETWWDAVLTDTIHKAETMPIDEFRSQLAQTPGLTDEQREYLMMRYMQAAKMQSDTGKNPYRVTQNEESLAGVLLAIELDKIKSLDQINAIYLEGGVPNWSTEDMLMVKRMWKAKNEPTGGGFSWEHPAVKGALQKLNKLYSNKDGAIDPERRGDYLQHLTYMEKNLRAGWGDPVKMEAAIESALRPARQSKAKLYLKMAFTPMPLWPRVVKKHLKTQPPRITTQAEYDALPSGAPYLDQDGTEWTKQ